MRLKILDRYLLKSFIGPFAVCVALFSVLVVLGRFFDKMQIFNNFRAQPRDIALYLTLGLPYWLNLVLPVATMLGLLFSLGALQQRGEITACRSAGIGSWRLFMPYFDIGLAISLFSLVGGLSFLPKSNFAARSLYRVEIKRQPAAVTFRRDQVVAAGLNHRRFTIGFLDVEKNEMTNIVVDRFGDNLEWIETLSAKKAVYQDGTWRFLEGTLRHYDPREPGRIIEDHFAERIVDIPERPSDFVLEDKAPEDMTGGEIARRIQRLKRLGVAHYKERVTLHLKIALPFAHLVVIALGIPFALRAHQHGRTQTFAYALGIAFLYWGLTSICQSFGEQGTVPAWVAAWIPNFVFGSLAIVLLRRASV